MRSQDKTERKLRPSIYKYIYVCIYMVYIARRLAAQIFPHQVNCAEKKSKKIGPAIGHRRCSAQRWLLTCLTDPNVSAHFDFEWAARAAQTVLTPPGGVQKFCALPPASFFWCFDVGSIIIRNDI